MMSKRTSAAEAPATSPWTRSRSRPAPARCSPSPGRAARARPRSPGCCCVSTTRTALPDGYRTQVGERGRLLSGGQRQRIALARAVLRDAPVLILDEPTAGLDPVSARALMPLLGTAMAGRTIIVITHDPALAAAADDILHISGTVRPADPAVIEGAQRAASRTQALAGVASGGGSA
jgi:ABC transporter